MARWMLLMLAPVCLILLTGCPYVAQVPLADPSESALDIRLIGTWTGSDENGNPFEVEIVPFNQSEYYAELRDEEGLTRCRVFPFKIDGIPFLHINELAVAEEGYFFARYEFTGDSDLEITLVGDVLLSEDIAADPTALTAAIAGHLHDPLLYDGETITITREE